MKKAKLTLAVSAVLAGYGSTAMAEGLTFNIGGQVKADSIFFQKYTYKPDQGEKVNIDQSAYYIVYDDSYLALKSAYEKDALKISSWVRFYNYGRIRVNAQAENKFEDFTVNAKFEQNIDDGLGKAQDTPIASTKKDGSPSSAQARDQYVKIAHASGGYLLGGRKIFFDNYIKGMENNDFLFTSTYIMENLAESRFNAVNVGYQNDMIDIGLVYSLGNKDYNNSHAIGIGERGQGDPYAFPGGNYYINDNGFGALDPSKYFINANAILSGTGIASTTQTVSSEIMGLYATAKPADNLEVSLEAFSANQHTALNQKDYSQRPDGKAGSLGRQAYALGAAYTIPLADTMNLRPFLNVTMGSAEAKQFADTMVDTQGTYKSSNFGANLGINFTAGGNLVTVSVTHRSINQKGDADSNGNIVAINENSGTAKSFKWDSTFLAYEVAYQYTFGKTGAYVAATYAGVEGEAKKTITPASGDDTVAKDKESFSVLGMRVGYAF